MTIDRSFPVALIASDWDSDDVDSIDGETLSPSVPAGSGFIQDAGDKGETGGDVSYTAGSFAVRSGEVVDSWRLYFYVSEVADAKLQEVELRTNGVWKSAQSVTPIAGWNFVTFPGGENRNVAVSGMGLLFRSNVGSDTDSPKIKDTYIECHSSIPPVIPPAPLYRAAAFLAFMD